jgi:hypothetical protein
MSEDRIGFKIYELKGMVSSFVSSAQHHDSYNYPMIKNIEKVVDEMVSLVKTKEGKTALRGYYSPVSRISGSKGFHKNA